MLTQTEINRRNFGHALAAIHRGDPVGSRKIAKAAIAIEDREARLNECEMARAFVDGYAELHRRGRNVAKIAAADHSTARSRRLEKAAANERSINALIADIHRGKKVTVTSEDIDRTVVQKVAPAWRYI